MLTCDDLKHNGVGSTNITCLSTGIVRLTLLEIATELLKDLS